MNCCKNDLIEIIGRKVENHRYQYFKKYLMIQEKHDLIGIIYHRWITT